MMNKYKSFILNLYSLYPQSNSINSNIIIRESMLFNLSISANFLFINESSNKIHNIMSKLLCKDEFTPTA